MFINKDFSAIKSRIFIDENFMKNIANIFLKSKYQTHLNMSMFGIKKNVCDDKQTVDNPRFDVSTW